MSQVLCRRKPQFFLTDISIQMRVCSVGGWRTCRATFKYYYSNWITRLNLEADQSASLINRTTETVQPVVTRQWALKARNRGSIRYRIKRLSTFIYSTDPLTLDVLKWCDVVHFSMSKFCRLPPTPHFIVEQKCFLKWVIVLCPTLHNTSVAKARFALK